MSKAAARDTPKDAMSKARRKAALYALASLRRHLWGIGPEIRASFKSLLKTTTTLRLDRGSPRKGTLTLRSVLTR